ncbi:MAG: LPS export ABC transporter periplasmic protein LptC [Chitinophagaceae bacterium]|nr:LPS export ABC transporter periplasmic protein LptC [Chitinophagaceae bacterium]
MINLSFKRNFLQQAAILCSCLFVLSCENDEGRIRQLTEKKILVEEAKIITSFFSQGGKMKAKLTAPLMMRYQTDSVYVEFPKSLHVDFYDINMQLESTLHARHGKYLENNNKVLLRDSVVVINVKGDTLKTTELWWDQNSAKFFTDKVVYIHKKDQQIVGGKGLEANQDLTNIIIRQPTGTVLMPNEAMPQ